MERKKSYSGITVFFAGIAAIILCTILLMQSMSITEQAEQNTVERVTTVFTAEQPGGEEFTAAIASSMEDKDSEYIVPHYIITGIDYYDDIRPDKAYISEREAADSAVEWVERLFGANMRNARVYIEYAGANDDAPGYSIMLYAADKKTAFDCRVRAQQTGEKMIEGIYSFEGDFRGEFGEEPAVLQEESSDGSALLDNEEFAAAKKETVLALKQLLEDLQKERTIISIELLQEGRSIDYLGRDEIGFNATLDDGTYYVIHYLLEKNKAPAISRFAVEPEEWTNMEEIEEDAG